MKQHLFERLYEKDWARFKDHTKRAMGRERDWDGKHYGQEIRRVSQHLAIAQSRDYGQNLIDRLNQLVANGRQQMYKDSYKLRENLIAFISTEFPQTVRRTWVFMAVAGGLFLASAIIVYLLVQFNPEAVYAVMEPAQVSEMEEMYQPDDGKIRMERKADTDAGMFGYYIQHNIGISFRTFAGGILFTLGSLFFIIFNGIFLGAVFSHLVNTGYGGQIFPFVIGHSAFEITALVMAGGAGIMLGWALISPGKYSRAEALRISALDAVKVMMGVLIFLLIAAFIEAFWSSTVALGNPIRYAVGAALWLLVFCYLGFAGKGHGERH